MNQYRNKETGEIVKADSFTKEFAFSHNSNYEIVLENGTKNESKNKKK